jgi:hypothetical protein
MSTPWTITILSTRPTLLPRLTSMSTLRSIYLIFSYHCNRPYSPTFDFVEVEAASFLITFEMTHQLFCESRTIASFVT